MGVYLAPGGKEDFRTRLISAAAGKQRQRAAVRPTPEGRWGSSTERRAAPEEAEQEMYPVRAPRERVALGRPSTPADGGGGEFAGIGEGPRSSAHGGGRK